MITTWKKLALGAASLSTLLLTGCATQGPTYAVSDHEIRSILVAPSVNETDTVEANTLMDAMTTYPLSEFGYYVFPMDTVKYVLEAEGLYEPERLQQLGPEKLAELFHSDSVLYVKITHWDATYALLNTRTRVTAEYTFYKADGTKIWSDTCSVYWDSNQGNSSGLIGLIVDAAVAAINRAAPDYRIASRNVNFMAIRQWEPGPYVRAAKP